MDIALNINTGPVSSKTTKKAGSKKRVPQPQNDFSFTFTKTDKVAATVSRIKHPGQAFGKATAFKRVAPENKVAPVVKKPKIELKPLDSNYKPKIFTNEKYTFLKSLHKPEKGVVDFTKQDGETRNSGNKSTFPKFSEKKSKTKYEKPKVSQEKPVVSTKKSNNILEQDTAETGFSLNIAAVEVPKVDKQHKRNNFQNKDSKTNPSFNKNNSHGPKDPSLNKNNSQNPKDSENNFKFSKTNDRNNKSSQKPFEGANSNGQTVNDRRNLQRGGSSSLFRNNPEVPHCGQRLVKPLNETVFTGKSLESLNIHPHCVKNLADILNITELTTVQERTVPLVLQGRDVLVRSQTGSGKTLAYGLPIIQTLQEIRPKLTRSDGIFALIVVPSRELAVQTYEFFIKLLKPFTWIVPGYLMGGEKRKAEKARLRRGINVLVGTPGRLCDHLLNSTNLKLDKVKWLVLDEADRLLELGYERDVRKLVDSLSSQKDAAEYDPMQQMRQVLDKAKHQQDIPSLKIDVNSNPEKPSTPRVNTIKKFDSDEEEQSDDKASKEEESDDDEGNEEESDDDESNEEQSDDDQSKEEQSDEESEEESNEESEEEKIEMRGTLQAFRGTKEFIKPKLHQNIFRQIVNVEQEMEDDDEDLEIEDLGYMGGGGGDGDDNDDGNDDEEEEEEDDDDDDDFSIEDIEEEDEDDDQDDNQDDNMEEEAESENEANPQEEQSASGNVGSSSNDNVDKKVETDNKDADKNEKLQTILLSATLTPAVEKLAGLALKDPCFIDCSEDNSVINDKSTFKNAVNKAISEDVVIPSSVTQSYILVPAKLRLVTLSGMIVKECRNKNGGKLLVFMATQDLIDFHFELLRDVLGSAAEKNNGLDSDEEDDDPLVDVEFFKLHGSMTQQERSKVFKEFRAVKSGVLLCTDVAARGLDVPAVNLVVQYSPPPRVADYVHRVGRTARAGRSGRAILFLAPNESEYIRELGNRRIRLVQDVLEPCLEALVNPTSLQNIGHGAKPVEGCATALQQRFEEYVADNSTMFQRSCKAFNSWVRFYSSFPRESRGIFNLKGAHMGHYAKSMALREPPTKAARAHGAPKAEHPVNRLTNDRNNDDRKHKFSKGPNKPKQLGAHARNRRLITSEFESGLPEKKRKNK